MAGRDVGSLRRRGGNRRGRATRERVVTATLDLVQTRPIAAIRVVDIAERAGMTSGHVMYHFGTREEIFAAALATSEEVALRDLYAALDGRTDPAERLVLWIAAWLPAAQEDPNWRLWLHFWFGEEIGEGEAPDDGPPGVIWREVLLTILHDGVAAGDFVVDDPGYFATWFHKLLLGVAVAGILGWMDLDSGREMARRRAADGLGCPALAASNSLE